MTALPSGYVLETYRIEKLLGEGGFGITYLASDVETGKRVAIKELLPKEFAARGRGSQVVPHGTHTVEAMAWALDSFMTEAKTLAALAHPNIVQIHRLFRANGTAYMVMDYVEGQSMRGWLQSLPTQPTETQLRDILMPLLDGLEHLHEARLLHRDIKPDNIFITARGKPVLLDFGSARADTGFTQTMTSLVSAGYSPFEQYMQKVRQSPATDIYAMAATMVRAITGANPVAAIDRSADSSLQPPLSQTHAKRYSREFLSAVDVAFAVHAAERPQSVAEWRLNFQRPASECLPKHNVFPTQSKRVEDTVVTPVNSASASTSEPRAQEKQANKADVQNLTSERPSSPASRGWMDIVVLILVIAIMLVFLSVAIVPR